MSDKPTNTIALPGVDFLELAKQAISAQILKGFTESPALIDQVVAGALTRKVNDKGHVDQYQHHNTMPFLQFVTEDLIRKAALDALTEHVEAMKPQIKAAVQAQLKKETPAIAAALVDGFAAHCKERYGITTAVKFEISHRSR